MTTLQDLDRIIPEIISQLEKIKSDMSKYKKIKTDYRAKTLINEITAKITQIKKVHDSYKRTPSYKNKNFDNYVESLRNYVNECKQIYQKIKSYEDVAGYNGDNPFSENPNELEAGLGQ